MAGNEDIGGTQSKGRAIFISYRRDDTEGESGRLYDDLVRAYGDDSVFMDVAGIQPGLDFRKAIDDNVAGCGVLLAIIGPTWATIAGHDGTRRLDNPDDYVRLEIASALKRGVPVIPVLVHEAHMPALDQLPEDLKDLRYRNSAELTHARWNSDVALLVAALKNYVTPHPAHPEEPVHASLPVQLPAPQPAAAAMPAAKSRLPLFLGIGVLVVLAAVGFAVWSHMNSGSQQAINPVTTPPVTTPAVQTTPAMTQPVMPATATATPQPTPSAPAAAASGANPALALAGIWKLDGQNGPKTDNLERLSVFDFGGQLSVHAFGTCEGKPCDWGIRKLTLNGDTATSEPWELRNNKHEIEFQRKVTASIGLSGDTLLVTVKNQTIDPSRGPMFGMRVLHFKKAQ